MLVYYHDLEDLIINWICYLIYKLLGDAFLEARL